MYNLEELLYLRIVEKSTLFSSNTISCFPVFANGSLRTGEGFGFEFSLTLSLSLTTFSIDIITFIVTVFLLSSRCSEMVVVSQDCLICRRQVLEEFDWVRDMRRLRIVLILTFFTFYTISCFPITADGRRRGSVDGGIASTVCVTSLCIRIDCEHRHFVESLNLIIPISRSSRTFDLQFPPLALPIILSISCEFQREHSCYLSTGDRREADGRW